MALKTVFNNILVQIIEDDSLITLSDNVVKTEKAKVVAVGDGTKGYPMSVYEGTTIFFNKSDATEITYEGETYYILSQLDIVAYEE